MGWEWFGDVWEGLTMPKMCSGHPKHVFGRGWEGLGRFERVWEVSGELGRVPIWSPNGGGGRAVTTDFFQEICRRI